MFVNTRLLSPVILDGITKAPPDSYEWHEWWDLQQSRCIHGYEVGDVKITGPHYHYLNFWRILASPRGGGRKVRMPPRFIDIDHDFYWELERCRKSGKDILVLKRRQAGFSYKNAQILGHEFSFVPDSYSVITAGMETYWKNTMRFVIDGLDHAADGEFYKHRAPDQPDFIQAMFVEQDEEGRKRKEGLLSVVHGMTSSSLQALVGKSPSTILYEEVGKFKGIKEVKAYMDPAMEAEGKKTGMQILIGTGGEDHESIEEVTDMFYSPDRYGLMEYDNIWDSEVGMDDLSMAKVSYFIPGHKFTETTDDDGNSHSEKAIPIILERRKKKEGDKKIWIKEVTQFPMTPQEALLVPSGNRFNAFKLNEQKARLLRSAELRDIVRVGDIDWDEDSNGNIIGATWKDNPISGIFRMTEPPVIDESTGWAKQGIYIAGTDSYDKDKAADEKRSSFGAIRIHKQFNTIDDSHDMPVCGMIDRPETSEEFYENTAKLCVFYGWALNLIEYSNILIFDWYRRNGFSRLIRKKPETVYAHMAKTQANYQDGIDPNTKHIWEQITADWIEKNYEKIFDLSLLNKLIKYRSDKNCDESIAFFLSIVHAHDNIGRPVKSESEERKFQPRRYVMKGGRMVCLH